MKKLKIIFLLTITLQSALLHAAEPILLVGNSFTGFTYAQISFRQLFKDRWVGGRNLDQHFRDPTTRRMICDDRTFVVLQDFSTRAANSALFQFDMDEMIPFVRSCGAVPVLFMTWETKDIGYRTVRDAYLRAGAKHNAQVIQIGTVWNRIRASDENMYQSFLEADGKHPTVRGAKVNAASLLRAFCSVCYQSFDWSGFNSSEVSFVKSIIEQEIVRVVTPPPTPPPPPPPPPPLPPVEDDPVILGGVFYLLLLDDDSP